MTIEFKENDHINEDKLNSAEAGSFVHEFLVPEMNRHIRLKAEALVHSLDYKYSHTARMAWNSSANEHQKDIDYINKTIDKLYKKFMGVGDHYD